MTYRVVYDVLDSSVSAQNRGELFFLLFALVWTTLLFFIYRHRRRWLSNQVREMLGGFLAGGLFIVIGVWLVATRTYPAYLENQRCKEWARRGDYQTAEGPITDFARGPGREPLISFRAGETSFTYRWNDSSKGSFHGSFTAPGTEGLRLRGGLMVRVAHRDGVILRIEIAE
jgi:hypothetical protein